MLHYVPTSSNKNKVSHQQISAKNRVTKVYEYTQSLSFELIDPLLIKRKIIGCFFLLFETSYKNYIIAVDLMENRIFEQDLNVWHPYHPTPWIWIGYLNNEDIKFSIPISTQDHKFLRLYVFRYSWTLRFVWPVVKWS